MNHPGDILARQSWDYIQNSLQAAGFNVWVHSNLNQIPPALLVDPLNEIIAVHKATNVYHAATGVYHGNLDSGSVFQYCIANHIEEEKDYFFNIGENLSCTFFIGGETLGTFASVSDQRKQEFRQLILKLKPTKTVGFLFINYV
jgi:hypothetical protein